MPTDNSPVEDGLRETPRIPVNLVSTEIEFDYEWRLGHRDKAREIARAYVNARRYELAPILQRYTLEELVREVSALRNAGRHADRIVVDMWLLSEYEPQAIVGVIDVTLPPPASLAQLRLVKE